jgi:hypothetical protein
VTADTQPGDRRAGLGWNAHILWDLYQVVGMGSILCQHPKEMCFLAFELNGIVRTYMRYRAAISARELSDRCLVCDPRIGFFLPPLRLKRLGTAYYTVAQSRASVEGDLPKLIAASLLQSFFEANILFSLRALLKLQMPLEIAESPTIG